ncbi:hypothetical protein PQX77_003225 [Marasmius sp. AFHP31]|nr:hypothetical protein PQX77_003225 [Marasmius sp. AFHP31]
MHCVHAPLPDSLFYWTSDPAGKTKIPKDNWGQYGIPELETKMHIGSSWWYHEYELARTYLRRKGYDTDGRQYTRDHGYPELVQGDPHHKRATELGDLDDEEPSATGSQLTSPSLFSLVNTPLESTSVHKEKCSIPALLVKGSGLWTKKIAVLFEPRQDRETENTNSGRPTVVRDGWDWVDSGDL